MGSVLPMQMAPSILFLFARAPSSTSERKGAPPKRASLPAGPLLSYGRNKRLRSLCNNASIILSTDLSQTNPLPTDSESEE